MKHMSINEVQDQIIDEFAVFDNWMDKYNFLIDLSKSLQPYDEKLKSNEYLINGCQSRVWVNAELINEKIVYSADSDAIITKGIVALLIRVLSDRTPEEILNVNLYFIDRIGLHENLSPTRSNGLLSMIKQMKLYALAYQTRMKKN
jgi:cysteine desulfuration protein SufE